MIRGSVSIDGVPTIKLSVAGREWIATVDTGFNGDLELPKALQDDLNARYVGRMTSSLAGGQTIEEDVYLVDFPFEGHTIQAVTTFVAESQLLIGTHLLNQYRLQIDFVRRTLELERVESS